MSYIKPPKGEDCEWFKGPPPEIGWWPASLLMNHPEVLRWWDGKDWSTGASPRWHRDHLMGVAHVKLSRSVQKQIEWTHRWWLTAPKSPSKEK
jgi:hypothetical protein